MVIALLLTQSHFWTPLDFWNEWRRSKRTAIVINAKSWRIPGKKKMPNANRVFLGDWVRPRTRNRLFRLELDIFRRTTTTTSRTTLLIYLVSLRRGAESGVTSTERRPAIGQTHNVSVNTMNTGFVWSSTYASMQISISAN